MPKLLQYINRVKVTSVKVADLETKNHFKNQFQYINSYYYKSI
jgi:septation ring formation regulator EzrA